LIFPKAVARRETKDQKIKTNITQYLRITDIMEQISIQ